MYRTNYTREELITICERAMLPQNKWGNRDSLDAQMGVYLAYGLLKAGCWYEIVNEKNFMPERSAFWIRFKAHSFRWFEEAGEDDKDNDGYVDDNSGDEMFYYLPTPERLDETVGRDWY